MASIAKKSLAICQLFEGELLLELMLRYWKHPFAGDKEFRSDLIETATVVLQEAAAGMYFVEGLQPTNMNFVAAVYYAELRACEESANAGEDIESRQDWLKAICHSLPSCFCNPDLLSD